MVAVPENPEEEGQDTLPETSNGAFNQHHLDFLRAVKGTVEVVDVGDRKIFGEVMYNVFQRAGIDFRRLMVYVDRNEVTVRRWINGENAPHKSDRKRIKQWCLDALAEEISVLSRLAREQCSFANKQEADL